jgi:hypothetical protein
MIVLWRALSARTTSVMPLYTALLRVPRSRTLDQSGGETTRPLISFDIDGTLEVGDPPGIVTIPMIRLAKSLGYVIGSCSDRPVSFQHALWERLRIGVDFTVLKHRLADVKALFPVATTYYHIGDTETDHVVAVGAGFRFLRADAANHQTWGPELFAPQP